MTTHATTTDDYQQLLALHQKVLEAHLRRDAELLLMDESDDYVVGSRGEVHTPTLAERRSRLTPYLQRTVFDVYRDTVPPMVKVSADGTLGWVLVQVLVQGKQETDSGEWLPLEATWAWMELYEKRNGVWLRTGNISTLKP